MTAPHGAAGAETADFPLVARTASSLADLDAALITCRACPRLVAWREEVGATRRAAYRDESYWSRPVPGFGDPAARVVVVGLAPAAHGGNRTGRMFTGDRSGDFLVAALHRTGFASQPTSDHPGDGLTLTGLRLTAPVHCAPPDNAPTPAERHTCAPWLARELELTQPRVAVVLGSFAWQALLTTLAEQGWLVPRPRPRFAHGAELELQRSDPPTGERGGELGGEQHRIRLLGCFHVSQQNTFTRRLTPEMLDAVLRRARAVADEA